MSHVKQVLINRLKSRGLTGKEIAWFLKDFSNSVVNNPRVNEAQLQAWLGTLGWTDLELDYHTIELTKACFEIDGPQCLEV